jgi:hypothetical protein
LPFGQTTDVLDRGQTRGAPALGIDEGEVRERHDRRNRLTGALDDDPLAGSRLVDNLAEASSNFEGSDCSHGVIIAPSWSIALGYGRQKPEDDAGHRVGRFRTPAVVLIAVPIAFNVAFFELWRTFDYPAILRKEPDEILRRFAAGAASVSRTRPTARPGSLIP